MGSPRSRRGSLKNLGPQLEGMIELYRATESDMREREKAVMEREIWEALSGQRRRNWSREYFLRDALGGSCAIYSSRGRLLNGGDTADELWRRVREEKMTVRTALGLLLETRKSFSNGKGACLLDTLALVLKEYDERPHIRTLPDGRIVRQGNSQNTPSRKRALKKNRAGGSEIPENPKELYKAIRGLVAAHVARQLEDVDEYTAEEIYEAFQIDLKLTIESLQQRIRSQKVNQQKLATLSKGTLRRHLRDAFDELALEAPRPNDEIDLMKVRKRYRKLAAVYHPDKHPNDPEIKDSMNRKFHAVTEAYHYICSFVEQADEPRKDSE